MTLNFVETAWLNAAHYNNAMDVYQTHLASKASKATGDAPKAAAAAPVQAKSSNLVNKIQETRNNIKEALNKPAAASDSNLEARIESVEAENKALKSELAALTQRFSALESRLNNLGSGAAPAPTPKAAAPAPAEEDDDDDDVDLFGLMTKMMLKPKESRPNVSPLTTNAKPPRRPRRVSLLPSQTLSWMSSHGMMKLIWVHSKLKFVKSKPMVSSGELQNSSQSATVSKSFKSAVSLKTIKSELTSSKKKSVPSKITSNPSMLPLSTKSKSAHIFIISAICCYHYFLYVFIIFLDLVPDYNEYNGF